MSRQARSTPRAHGTYACYQLGPAGTKANPDPCHCDACRAANRDYGRAYRKAGRDSWVNRNRRSGGGCVRGLGWPR